MRSLDARSATLEVRHEQGWRRGFANLVRLELGGWFGTRRWWVQALVWVAILNGIQLVPLVLLRALFVEQGDDPLAMATEMFFTLAALAPAAGAVILTHGAIIGERQLGTAAWILSKPVSRPAFVLAKLVAHAAGMLATSIALPATLAYVVLSLENRAPLPVGAFMAGVGLVVLVLLFYLSLTLMLGTLSRQRGPVLAIPFVLLFGSDLAVAAWGGFGATGPWLLGRFAMLVAQGGPLPSVAPVVATVAWTVAFVGVAIRAFARDEF